MDRLISVAEACVEAVGTIAVIVVPATVAMSRQRRRPLAVLNADPRRKVLAAGFVLIAVFALILLFIYISQSASIGWRNGY
jgi:hypothetical protein